VKLVIDTNTLVSGSLWSGLPSRLLDAVEQKRATLILSVDLLAEFAEVIGRPRLAQRLTMREVTPNRLVSSLARLADFVSVVAIPIPPSLRDPKDLIVLAAAQAGKVDAIVTGDDDLLALKSFEGIPILTTREILNKLGLPTE
jgi:putative PIN family toxin of toxin-antitoxin system